MAQGCVDHIALQAVYTWHCWIVSPWAAYRYVYRIFIRKACIHQKSIELSQTCITLPEAGWRTEGAFLVWSIMIYPLFLFPDVNDTLLDGWHIKDIYIVCMCVVTHGNRHLFSDIWVHSFALFRFHSLLLLLITIQLARFLNREPTRVTHQC